MDHRLNLRRLPWLFVASALGFALSSPVTALAADPTPTAWGVQPSGQTGPDGRATFEYSVAPGATIVDYVGVSNLGDAPLTVHLYATDAFNTDDGGFALLTVDQDPTDVGSWVGIAEDTYVIPARKRLDIPFEVRVPVSAEPGDHIGGIVASVEVPATDANGNSVIVDRRVGSRIYLNVQGGVEASMSLGGLTASYDSGWNLLSGTLTVTYTVRNTGNIRLSAHQEVVVTGPFGMALKGVPVDDLPELLPGASVTATTTITSLPPVGMVTASVRIEPYSATRGSAVSPPALTGQTDSWALPLLLAGIILLAFEAVIALIWWRRRRRSGALADRERAIGAARAEGLALGRAQADAPESPQDDGAAPGLDERSG